MKFRLYDRKRKNKLKHLIKNENLNIFLYIVYIMFMLAGGIVLELEKFITGL